MIEPKRFPAATLSLIETNLAELLHGYVIKREVPRCLLAFVGDGHSLEVRPALKTDETWQVLYAKNNEGLIGHVLRTGTTASWPDEGPSTHFKQGDPRTVYEFGAPILYQGAPIAVLLVDYFIDEQPPQKAPDWKLQQWCREIEGRLTASINREKEEIEKSILVITQRCVTETESVGGYTALKRWDGRMMYVLAGKNAARFRYFSQLEGICGEVLRKNEPQNVPYVWDHPKYRSSDDRVLSEFVAPIAIRGECVGVLNMEAIKRANYNAEYQQKILYYAEELTLLVDRYRRIIGSQIGTYGSLLSDLIEQLSAPVDEFFELSTENSIRAWALDLLGRKVSRLDGVGSFTFPASEATSQGNLKPEVRRAGEPPFQYELTQRADGDWECEFDMLDDAITTSKLKVVFNNRPEEAMLEIIDQFCRLAMNEVRRREEGARAVLFERFMADICYLSTEELLAVAPARFKDILNCDAVTYFSVQSFVNNGRILVPWSSTSKSIGVTANEYYYRVAPDDGFTGFAATQRDILLIRNTLDEQELKAIHPLLSWKGKVYEDAPGPIRSYFAIPLYIRDELVGLLRGHRNVKTNNVSFPETDRARLRLLKVLLEAAIQQSTKPEHGEENRKVRPVPNRTEAIQRA